MAHQQNADAIVEVGTSEATGRDIVEVPAGALVVRDQDRAWAESYEGDDPHGTKSLIIVWRAKEGEHAGRYIVRSGVRRVLNTAPDERVTAEVQRLFPSGRESVEVDPKILVIGVNPRVNTKLDEGFLSRIEEDGVRTAVNADLDDDGRIVVDEGQRRTLGALEKGVRVAVMIDAVFDGDARAKAVKKLFSQINENDQRKDFDPGERLGAYQTLLDLKVSAADISKNLSADRPQVDAMIASLGSKAARGFVESGDLDPFQGAIIAEFEEYPELQAQLITQAERYPSNLEFRAQTFRDNLERQRKGQEIVAALEADGVKVIPWADTDGAKVRFLSDLRSRPTSKPGTRVRAKTHASCPGHAAALEPVELKPQYVCLDFVAHGHATRNAPEGQATEPNAPSTVSEDERRTRSLKIKHGKDMKAANTVRRKKWLRDNLLSRKSMPKDALNFVGMMLAEGVIDIVKAMEVGHPEAVGMLRLKADESLHRYSRQRPHPIAARLENATQPTTIKYLLVITIAAIEEKITHKTWYEPPQWVQTYLRFAESWGHKITRPERITIDWVRGQDIPDWVPDEDLSASLESVTDDEPADGDGTEPAAADADHTEETVDE